MSREEIGLVILFTLALFVVVGFSVWQGFLAGRQHERQILYRRERQAFREIRKYAKEGKTDITWGAMRWYEITSPWSDLNWDEVASDD